MEVLSVLLHISSTTLLNICVKIWYWGYALKFNFGPYLSSTQTNRYFIWSWNRNFDIFLRSGS